MPKTNGLTDKQEMRTCAVCNEEFKTCPDDSIDDDEICRSCYDGWEDDEWGNDD